MKSGLLAERVYRGGKSIFVACATADGWDRIKQEYESHGIDYFAVELRPDDASIFWIVAAAAPFKRPASPCPSTALFGLNHKATQKTHEEGAGWLLSMAEAADKFNWRHVASPEWGALLIHSNERPNGNNR